MVFINDLPDEIIELILFNLPPYKDLDSCALVCKRWAYVVHNVKRLTNNNLQKGLSDYRLNWKSLVQLDMTPTIAARFSHAAIVHGHSMYVYGGGSSTETTFNDLWRFDLSKREWIRPISMGTYPTPKACATVVCYENSLVLFGGWRHPPSNPPHQPWRLFNELHVYNITNNQWTLNTPAVSPPPLTGHSATVHGNKMVVFGGYQDQQPESGSCNNVWCLDLDTYTWCEKKTSNVKPPPRYGQFQVFLDDDHLLILGGCGGPNSIYSDAWLLNMSSELWTWKSVNIENRKWSATHMWCNTACKVGSKLVVLGPIASASSDFQMIRQHRSGSVPIAQPAQQVRNLNVDNRNADHRGRHQLPNGHQPVAGQPALRNPNQIVEEANRRLQEERNRPINRDNIAVGSGRSGSGNPGPSSGYLTRRPYPRNVEDEEDAANRLKRNLQLKSRDTVGDQFLPKRFDEPLPDLPGLGMAAFSVQENTVHEAPPQNERRLEGLRRMEEKIRTMRRVQDVEDRPSPKRIKRNCIGLFVCDISRILSPDSPSLDWIEHKNNGIIDGAPEHLIMSSMVAGNGELILFGGLRRESLSNATTLTLVSNSLHFLSFPREIN